MFQKTLFLLFLLNGLFISTIFSQVNTDSSNPLIPEKKYSILGNVKLRVAGSFDEIHRDEYNLGKGFTAYVGVETKLFTERVRLFPEFALSDKIQAFSINLNGDILRTRSKELALTLALGVNWEMKMADDAGFQGGLGFTLCPRKSRFSFEFLPLNVFYTDYYRLFNQKLSLKYSL